MSKAKRPKLKKKTIAPAAGERHVRQKQRSLWPWILSLAGITLIVLSPMLNNGFTNWDDEFYVQNNALLHGPDWKGIFTQPVNDNYHPLTIISLAINYQLSGLSPFSYLLFNLLLHLANTTLVFYLGWLLSGKKNWIAFFTALIFAIHPMHVESVAWVSERKDVLYTFFLLLSLIQYWKYIQTSKGGKYWTAFLFFIFSLLAKPAAIVLPAVLFLFDYWKGRRFNQKLIAEKIPFLILALVFAVITLIVQSKKAIVSSDVFPLWERLFFASYGIMIYFFRFFIPYPLSAFHPFPIAQNLSWPIIISPLFVIALAILIWYLRKDKLVVFCILFYVINLLLVLQIVAIGNAIIAERYSYVPYIGLALLIGTWVYKYVDEHSKKLAWLAPVCITLVFGAISFQRTKVWNSSITLWNNVLDHYPNAPVARTNRANYFYKLAIDSGHASEASSLYQSALEDCNVALKTEPRHQPGYEIRGLIFQNLHRYGEALADGQKLIQLAPEKREGYSISSTANMYLNHPDEALADLDMCIKLKPDDDISLNNRGTILYNKKRYSEAQMDYSKAIELNPKGSYYLNRSFCYFELGDLARAKTDAQMALQKGIAVDTSYLRSVNL